MSKIDFLKKFIKENEKNCDSKNSYPRDPISSLVVYFSLNNPKKINSCIYSPFGVKEQIFPEFSEFEEL